MFPTSNKTIVATAKSIGKKALQSLCYMFVETPTLNKTFILYTFILYNPLTNKCETPHTHTLSGLGTGTPVKSDWVILVL